MKNTLERIRVNNRVSPAFIELLILERSKGKSLRQLGQLFGKSHEKIRKLLARYYRPQATLLTENRVATMLGYPASWLAKLRKEGISNPIRPGASWLYSEEQVRQVPSLITEERKCQQCGKPCPLHSGRFCTECLQYRRKHRYQYLSPEKKAEHLKRTRAWRKANPEMKGDNRRERKTAEISL